VVLYNKLNHKPLLQDGAVEYFSLNGQLHFEPFAVRLCPYEASINKLHLLQALAKHDMV
jgi:hypothetical protein